MYPRNLLKFAHNHLKIIKKLITMKDIRHDIDGLKGIAILAVVFYHLFDLLKSAHFTESTLFDGGFLGVDIFFVISGFLITSSVFYKLSNNDFSLLAFYKRRFLRIVPPLLFVCIFTLIVGYFLLFPMVYRELNIEVANALLFIGNFRFANSGGYFALDSSDKLLLHTWYLAVTIQFYILFPLIVLLLKKVFSLKRLPLAVTVVFILLTVTSVLISRNGKGYLLTQCRIFELFFGSVLFFYKDIVYKRVFSLNSYLPLLGEVLGIVIIIASIFTVELQNGIWTVTTSLPTMLGTALVILSHNKNSVLRLPPLTLLGKSSYSLYLWHWPLFVFALRCGLNESYINYVIVFVLLGLLNLMSYLLVEKHKLNYKTVAILYFCCFSSYIYFKSGPKDTYIFQFEIKQPAEIGLSKEYQPSVVDTVGTQSLWHYGEQKEIPHIMIVGDSNALQYRYFFKFCTKIPTYEIAKSAIMAYGKEFASFSQGYYVPLNERQDFYNLYKKTLSTLNDGDKVILSSRWTTQYKNYLKEKNLLASDKTYSKYMDDIIKDIDEQIKKYPKLHFYIIGTAFCPSWEYINRTQLDLKDSFLEPLMSKKNYMISSDFHKKYNDYTNDRLQEYANSHNNVSYIDRNIPLKVGGGKYRMTDDHEIPLFYDPTHYTVTGGKVVGKYILDEVLKN